RGCALPPGGRARRAERRRAGRPRRGRVPDDRDAGPQRPALRRGRPRRPGRARARQRGPRPARRRRVAGRRGGDHPDGRPGGVAERGHGRHDPLLRVAAPAPARRCRRRAAEPTGRHAAPSGRVHDEMTDESPHPAAGDDLIAEIGRLEGEGRDRLAAAATLDELRAAETAVVGKRSPLTGLRRRLGALDPEGRRTVGKALNAALEALEAVAAARRAELAAEARRRQLEAERLDLTEVTPGRPAGHLHLVTQAIEELEDVFVGMGFTVAEGPEIETEWHNFGALNFPPDHPARDEYDTLYVGWGERGSTLLRTHPSPGQVRVMAGSPPPYYCGMPGRVFRSDTADATHMPVFHQIEGLVGDRDITFADLAGTIDAFAKAYFGGDFTSRLRASYFPFTEPSAEFDIQRPDGTWLELGGCGMVHPNVLANCGLDPDEW